jgi:hypothetical protein
MKMNLMPHALSIVGILLLTLLSALQPTVQRPDGIHPGGGAVDGSNSIHAALAGRMGRIAVAWAERNQNGSTVRISILRFGMQSGRACHSIIVPLTGAEDVHPSVTWLSDTTLLVVWERSVLGRHGLLAQLFDEAAEPRGPQFTVTEPLETTFAGVPHTRTDSDGDALIVWQDNRDGNMDVYARHMGPRGNFTGPAKRVNTGDARALQGAPRLVAGTADVFLIL